MPPDPSRSAVAGSARLLSHVDWRPSYVDYFWQQRRALCSPGGVWMLFATLFSAVWLRSGAVQARGGLYIGGPRLFLGLYYQAAIFNPLSRYLSFF